MRRNLLMSYLTNQFKWLPYSFEYLYHDLIPATINNKQVKDKTRLFKIEGNSEVVNQLFDYHGLSSQENNGITYINNNDGSFTLSGTATANSYYTILDLASLVDNHYYLIYGCASGGSTSSYMIRIANGQGGDLGYDIGNGVVVKNTSGMVVFMRVVNGTALSTAKKFVPQIIDLGKRYPFDTPTSLTDKRVQNIINRGSEDFNSGEIKNTSLGGFVSEGFNICDEIFEGGVLGNIGQTESDSNSFRTKNYQEVLPNQTLNLHASSTMFGTLIVCEYDKDKNFVLRSLKYESDQPLTTQQNTKYIKIAFYKSGSSWQTNVPTKEQAQVCINRSSALNGTYKPHLNRLPTEYQEVEYVESTGTQYIDSGVLATDTTGLLINVAPLNNDEAVFIGTKINTIVDDYYGLYIGINPSYKIFGNFNGNDDASARPTAQLNTKFLYKLNYRNNRKRYFNETELTSISTTLPSISYPIYIGCGNRGNNLWLGSSARFYSCQITDGTSIIRHFIPCFRKSDNEIGLFDLVNQVFYTNSGTGTFSKGKNVASVSDLSFAYQGSGVGTSHDSIEKTATEWVFTKDRVKVDMGSLDWLDVLSDNTTASTSLNTTINKPSSNDDVANVLCELYQPASRTNLFNQTCICVNTGGNVIVYDSSLAGKTGSQLKTLFSGKNIEYQLATPQVIRIPLKHLAVVDLGSLTYVHRSSDNVFSLPSGTLPLLKTNGLVYCSIYRQNVGSIASMQNMEVSTANYYNVHDLIFKNTIYTNATDFKNGNKGIYLFYETQDEVPDIDLTMNSEVGGELNSYDFKWIRNQLRKDNISFSGNLSVSTNSQHKIVITGSTSLANTFAISLTDISSDYAIKLNHKYLIAFKGKETRVKAYRIYVYSQSGYVANIGDIDSPIIVSGSQTYAGNYFRLAISPTADEVFNDELELMIIDLTKAQLDDATSINDPRIQRIIKLDYIPTDINGTLTYEETEVLPNVDVKEKAK